MPDLKEILLINMSFELSLAKKKKNKGTQKSEKHSKKACGISGWNKTRLFSKE